jgi:hypothetical protein
MKGLAPEAAPLKRRVFDCQNTNDTARRQVRVVAYRAMSP